MRRWWGWRIRGLGKGSAPSSNYSARRRLCRRTSWLRLSNSIWQTTRRRARCWSSRNWAALRTASLTTRLCSNSLPSVNQLQKTQEEDFPERRRHSCNGFGGIRRRSAGLDRREVSAVAQGQAAIDADRSRPDWGARLRRMEEGDGRKRLGHAHMAHAIWRRRTLLRPGARVATGDEPRGRMEPHWRHGRHDVRPHAARIRQRRTEKAAYPWNSEWRREVVSGLFGAGRRFRSCGVTHTVRGQRRSFSRQWSENLDIRGTVRRLVLLSGKNRQYQKA